MITTNKIKNNKVLSIGLLAILTVGLAACTDHYDSLNTPDNSIVADNIDGPQLGQTFAHAQYFGMMAASYFRCQTQISNLWTQYFSQTPGYFESDQLIDPGVWNNDCWNPFYSGPASSLDFVENFTEENSMTLENAVAKVWRVNIYHRFTDYYGPIPYSEYGSGETSVAYDSQEEIYLDFFETLDEAVAVFDQNPGGSAFAADDQIFGGDTDQWRTFANSLRLRLAMRISYVEPDLAEAEAAKALDAGVILDNSENVTMTTSVNNRNWLTIWTYIDEFRMSATSQSIFTGFEDPRLSEYFSEAVDGGGYKGFRNGLPGSAKGNFLNTENSFVDEKWYTLPNGGANPPNRIMDAAEVYFLRAEGALNGWAMGGTPEELYNEGIRMSISDRTDASSAEIEAYIVSTNTPAAVDDDYNTPPVSDIPIQYQAGADFETQQEQIITQKWIALYPDGWEAWSERRRTGYPRGYAVINSLNPDIAEDELIRRRTFTSDERSNNGAAVQAAEALLNGPDEMTTRLWWDAKPLTAYPDLSSTIVD
ncbi:MAG: SusD/RagB family nutrient-binding outer membrane lipoprotein [Balneolaceae bacterium]